MWVLISALILRRMLSRHRVYSFFRRILGICLQLTLLISSTHLRLVSLIDEKKTEAKSICYLFTIITQIYYIRI